MHLYNAWLPPVVAAAARGEAAAFASAVRGAADAWRPGDPDSAYATLKWISVFDLFIKAKSDIAPEDVQALVELGLEIFHASQNKFVVQIKWGGLLVRLLRKHGKRLSLGVQWRPLYDTLIRTHFKRNMGPEGWKVRQRHFETVTSLVRASRNFFPEGAAAGIWSEFRPLLENPWHNSAFEGVGFLRLFLPANSRNQDHFTIGWIAQCVDIWDSVTNCNFWDIQWASIIARCIKNSRSVNWDDFLPLLFTRYLNTFEVPISSGNGSYPFPVGVPGNTRFLFSSKTRTPSKAIAKSIVYLLKPKSLALEYFEKLINFLEQFYHPSNGGRWTYSLERFLRYLVVYFEKRLQHEQFDTMDEKHDHFCLGKEERAAFIKVILKLLDRGQYSKNDSLAETVSIAASILSYVEPSLVLPFVATNFQLALETTTATHQLKNAVTSVAFSGRPLLLCSSQSDDSSAVDSFSDLIVACLSNALLGMDANDPPKTIATMQLIGSIFSNLATVGVSDEVPAFLQATTLSDWLDEFFSRLFSVLCNLESSSPINEGYQTSFMSGTFLVEDSPYYFCMLEVLLGKLSKPLFNQSLKRIAKFVNANILPGATSEVGLLCCACVHSYPELASVYLVKPILMTIMSSFEGTPTTGYVGRVVTDKTSKKAALSPALETALDYYLRVLALAISYAGPVLLNYREELKHIITSAFQAPSWKVNGAGDHLLRSLLGNLVFYYPIDQYKPFTCQPIAKIIEPWGCSKAHQDREIEMLNFPPKWHDPSLDELSFANELLQFHFQSALEDLLTICQMKVHSETGDEKEHLKVTLLRIYSALHGVMSCLPEMRPTYKDGRSKEVEPIFFIAGSAGSTVGSSEMREKASELVHTACRYLLKERTDDSILLALVVRVIDALVNYGSLEYEEWSSHVQAWKLESAAIIEPPCNFIVPFHTQGKKRPRWALVDKAHLHSTWRCSQSSYHRYRTNVDVSPSGLMINLMNDLLDLSLHNYETVRSYAGRSLMKLLKRWPSLISNCVLTLTENLRNPKAPEHVVLGSCSILLSQTVLRHLTTDSVSLSSFIMGILESSHHESLKCQKAITEIFVKYNIHFSGISRNFFKNSEIQADKPGFLSLFSQINALGFETKSLHWRYNLMANRVLLLLILASRSESGIYSQILAETAGHFLRNLKSQLPHSRMLAISALNTLLQGSPHKASSQDSQQSLDHPEEYNISSTGEILNEIIREEGFMNETLNSLSHVHIISDNDGSSKASYGASSFQSGSDKAITYFYFDFSASWPRTPSWISLVGGDTFYSSFARIFKRLIQQCGMPVMSSLQTALEEFLSSKERSRQCVAAEAMAGMLHSDITGNLESGNNWLMVQLQKIMLAPSVESVPDWAACIRYAVTGKGRSGARAPVLRQKVLECLCSPVPQFMATSVLAKRYSFLSVALIEISPPKMSPAEKQYHVKILDELLDNMSHPSAQVREAIGVAMCVACSNMRLSGSFGPGCSPEEVCGDVSMIEQTGNEYWTKRLTDGANELSVSIQNNIQSKQLESISDSATENSVDHKEEADAKRMETIFHFMIASLKSGRSSVLLDVIIRLMYPILSLQETSNKDLSLLAKSTFELLKWRILRRPFLEAAIVAILSSVNDPNWRTRSALLSYLRTFTYRHTFILSGSEKSQIWQTIEKLLVDNQVEVREHAAGVLASLMKGIDKDLSKDFRDRSYAQAQRIINAWRRNSKSGHSVATIHGAVLALTASVLSVPYDMPSWLPAHVTLLARFIREPPPIRSTVTKAVAEFKRTHADTWSIQKDSFTEDELEVLRDTSSSSSYFV
ncbi:proteasome activator subunit 4 [Phragmites australis]|uniref:proteasome activator subunit 4 n=1 Tax=Phragmites australis TaxID=29695 RepID=UPI002D7875FD|nr:proteasome activator subunit 4 [Phragmites australis]